jgi:succinate dehydrogenase/fumarate reductase cytochrome b subunit (b558 family)
VSDPAATKSLFDKSRRPFLLRKLHSLTGIVPVGVFLVFHLWTNAKALQGREQFDKAVAEISHMPYLLLLEGGILLPLLFHAVYGVVLALEGKPNVGKYPYSRNWMYTLQRVTGVMAFLFIGFHLYEYWLQKLLGNMTSEDFYPALIANMSSTWKGVPVTALVYILGIAASAFHFANGLWAFCFSWGITVSRTAQRRSATVFGIVGLLVLALGCVTVLYFATGSRYPNDLFGSREPGGAGALACADVGSGHHATDVRAAPARGSVSR